MRHGLMAWDPSELPAATLEARLQCLKSAMQAANNRTLLLYSHFGRPGAVTWLTGFTPYWNDALVMVGTDRPAPIIVTSMSHRNQKWIESMAPCSFVVTTPAPGKWIGQLLGALGRSEQVCVLERDMLPRRIVDELLSEARELQWSDAGDLVDRARAPSDDAEKALFFRAGFIARSALDTVNVSVSNGYELSARVDRAARLSGAEEVLIAIAPDLSTSAALARPVVRLADRFAVRVSLAYKGVWVRCTRTFDRADENTAQLTAAEHGFQRLLANLCEAVSLEGQVIAAFGSTNRGAMQWSAEKAVGTRPLEAIGGIGIRPGVILHRDELIVLNLRLMIGGRSWLAAGPAIVGEISDEQS